MRALIGQKPMFYESIKHRLVRQSQIVQSVIDSSGTVVPY